MNGLDALEPAPTEVTPGPLPREILDETPDKARFCFICQIYPWIAWIFVGIYPPIFPCIHMTYLSQVEKPAAGLTPTLHHDMCTTQGNNMKRGRKAKRGKATKRTKKVKRTTKRTKGLKNASTPAPRPKAANDSPLSSSKRKLKTLRKMRAQPSSLP